MKWGVWPAPPMGPETNSLTARTLEAQVIFRRPTPDFHETPRERASDTALVLNSTYPNSVQGSNLDIFWTTPLCSIRIAHGGAATPATSSLAKAAIAPARPQVAEPGLCL